MVQKAALKKVHDLVDLCPILRKFPIHRLNIRYDEEADVLYVKFADTKPIHQSELTKDDILVEYDKDKNMVGVTILDVSRRK